MDEIYNILSPYRICIIKQPVVRHLTKEEIQHLIVRKQNDINLYKSTSSYNQDTIKVIEQENWDIYKLQLENTPKYSKLLSDNIKLLESLKRKENKVNIKPLHDEVQEIIYKYEHNIPISSNEYGGYSIPEKRYDE